jgi:hypothetical protein
MSTETVIRVQPSLIKELAIGGETNVGEGRRRGGDGGYIKELEIGPGPVGI